MIHPKYVSNLTVLLVCEENAVPPAQVAVKFNEIFSSVFMNESPLPNNNRLPRLNSAPGYDGVCYKLLKLAKPAISEILDALFQQSIDMACIPSDWRQGRVLPILKFDDPLNPSNYRPFSLTSTCCEILQHIISYTVMKFLTEHIFFLQSTCIFAWSIMRDATL